MLTKTRARKDGLTNLVTTSPMKICGGFAPVSGSSNKKETSCRRPRTDFCDIIVGQARQGLRLGRHASLVAEQSQVELAKITSRYAEQPVTTAREIRNVSFPEKARDAEWRQWTESRGTKH